MSDPTEQPAVPAKKVTSGPLAWARKFLAAAFGGGADGLIIGLSGTGAMAIGSGQPAEPHPVLYMMAVNILLDTARFVKANPDPWEFALPPAPPQS
jgi:hypothetical protein